MRNIRNPSLSRRKGRYKGKPQRFEGKNGINLVTTLVWCITICIALFFGIMFLIFYVSSKNKNKSLNKIDSISPLSLTSTISVARVGSEAIETEEVIKRSDGLGSSLGKTNHKLNAKKFKKELSEKRQIIIRKASSLDNSSMEDVSNFLAELAKMPTPTLRNAFNFEVDDGYDPLDLSLLERGECPNIMKGRSRIPWLPQRPSGDAASIYRSRHEKNRNDAGDKQPVAVVWYEHLSKAGGTSFCKLAQENMRTQEVPSYYCMPSNKESPDARVGQWTNKKFIDYINEKPHRLVSNEWEPFPIERLDLQQQQENESLDSSLPMLVFTTSIRHPLNRLVSAYTFWGITNNSAANKPDLLTWLHRRENMARSDWTSPQRLGKRVGVNGNFLAQVGRSNFAVWKFSDGSLPVSSPDSKSLDSNEWLGPFQLAVRTLSRFDLVMPMELLSPHPEPLKDLLGWESMEKAHVVNIGKVQNSNAASDLTPEDYESFWNANKLDMVIYYWSRAVYLMRLHCPA
mmetsp:Transcript_3038/g.3570  ORF Transcript_3038/g.3570 Transcript_3038/m.3570 type:complete len:514 (+) Transcript_3038:137-1678(+)